MSVLTRTWRLSFLVVFLAAAWPVAAQTTDRDRQISELEKQLTELRNRLAELKKTEEPAKSSRTLDLSDAVTWKRLGDTALSRDGKWFACRVGPAEGEGEVVVRQTGGEQGASVPGRRGQLRPARRSPTTANGSRSPRPRRRRVPRRRRRPARPPPPAPAGKVVLVNLADGEKAEFEGVRRFAFSGEAASVLALHTLAAPPRPSPAPSPAASGPAERPGGSDLVLRDLATGNELTLGNVAEFAFDKKGQLARPGHRHARPGRQRRAAPRHDDRRPAPARQRQGDLPGPDLDRDRRRPGRAQGRRGQGVQGASSTASSASPTSVTAGRRRSSTTRERTRRFPAGMAISPNRTPDLDRRPRRPAVRHPRG